MLDSQGGMTARTPACRSTAARATTWTTGRRCRQGGRDGVLSWSVQPPGRMQRLALRTRDGLPRRARWPLLRRWDQAPARQNRFDAHVEEDLAFVRCWARSSTQETGETTTAGSATSRYDS